MKCIVQYIVSSLRCAIIDTLKNVNIMKKKCYQHLRGMFIIR